MLSLYFAKTKRINKNTVFTVKFTKKTKLTSYCKNRTPFSSNFCKIEGVQRECGVVYFRNAKNYSFLSHHSIF